MTKKRYDIQMFIKTSGIDYDDRLRKECISLSKLGKKIKIIALEDRNTKSEGSINQNVSYSTIRLVSRNIFPHKKFLAIKLLEMNLKFILCSIKYKSKIKWVHNIELAGILPFLGLLKRLKVVCKVVWDHHELITTKSIKRKYYKFRFRKGLNIADVIISANKERSELIQLEFEIPKEKCYTIENFVDAEFREQPYKELPEQIQNWLKKDKYLLAQGGAGRSRYFEELCQAILNEKEYKLIVVGPFNESQIMFLKSNFGEEHKNWIFFTGMINQMEIPQYIDFAYASIIFYSKEDSMNLVLCAPNRLYQALGRGIPIIVGNNPPMKSVVEKYENGIVLNSDGKDIADIQQAIQNLKVNYSSIKKKAKLSGVKFVWETQENVIKEIISVEKRA
jgi:glycosyltransferase involved in cell wall biosynthesis